MDQHTMMAPLARINPRRPFSVTAGGLKRFILGQSELGNGGIIAMPEVGHPSAAAKPLRPSGDRGALLAVVHSERGGLDEHARQTIAAAALLADADSEVLLLVLGPLNEEIASLGGDQAMVLAQFDHQTQAYAPDLVLAALCNVIDILMPQHIFMPDNGGADSDLGRRLAAAMLCDDAHASVATHVVELQRSGVAVYRQQRRLLARRSLPRLILLSADAVDARLPFVGRGQTLPLSCADLQAPATSAYLDGGISTLSASQVALEEADFIVSAGNGVADVRQLETLATVFDAAIGASRVAVDDGKLSRDKQIGATGKTVSASIYMAFGISGAVQHLQGIKNCRHVIACNTDVSAPMVKRADLSVIADAHELMSALLQEVRLARGATHE